MVAVRRRARIYPVSEPLVIVGNGMATARLVDELTRCALARHAIAVIGDEPRLAYNRVLLSSVLAGETAPELGSGPFGASVRSRFVARWSVGEGRSSSARFSAFALIPFRQL